MAEVSHAILLFPESVGSYAETGLFSAYQDIRSKVLVAQPREFQTSRSFLADGPIHAILQDTIFGRVISFDSKNGLANFTEVYDMLASSLPRLEWTDLGLAWSGSNFEQKVALVQLLFEIFPLMTYSDIQIAIDKLVGEKTGRSLSEPVSYLTSLGGVRKDDAGYYYPTPGLYDYQTPGARLGELKLSVESTYSESHPMMSGAR